MLEMFSSLKSGEDPPGMTSPHLEITDNLRSRIREALAEDLGGQGDITSKAIFGPDHRARARIVSKDIGTIAGLVLVKLVYEELDPEVRFEQVVEDGTAVMRGDEVARLEGPTRSILAGERLGLNFLQRLSGVASITHCFVEVCDDRLAICDTRKTTPHWRDLEKYAVLCGGGTNHRFGLYDMVMIKDTHADGCGGLGEALRRVEKLRPQYRVAAEARDLGEVRAAVEGGADLLMLDNMEPEILAEAVKIAKGRVPIEVTGGIVMQNVRALADLGVERVSIGAITHSAKAMDFSLKIELEA